MWDVSDTNRAPVVTTLADRSDAEGSVVIMQTTASDPDGDMLRWSVSGLPPGIEIDEAMGEIAGTIAFAAAVGSPFEVTMAVVDDGEPALSSVARFIWIVGDVNRPPSLAELPDRAHPQDEPLVVTLTGDDADGDALTWVVTGLPTGLSADGPEVVGTPSEAGSFTVAVSLTDGRDTVAATFAWLIEAAGIPTVDPIENQTTTVGQAVRLVASGSDLDGDPLTFGALGLPPGLGITPQGLIQGAPTVSNSYVVTIRATDPAGHEGIARFTWTVEAIVDLAPVAGDDHVAVRRDELSVDGSVVVDVLGNDVDPEGSVIRLVGVGTPDVGSVDVVDGVVVFSPPEAWTGTVGIGYTIEDPAGNRDVAVLTITVDVDLGTAVLADALTVEAAAPGRTVDVVSLDAAVGTELVLGTVFQSIHVLRVPLALLGGAVLWSLILGGLLNVGFLARRGGGLIVRWSSTYYAIVMAGHGEKVAAHAKPSGGEVVHRFLATDRGLQATGRTETVGGVRWVELVTPGGAGWIPAGYLTEYVDRDTFCDDPEPAELVAFCRCTPPSWRRLRTGRRGRPVGVSSCSPGPLSAGAGRRLDERPDAADLARAQRGVSGQDGHLRSGGRDRHPRCMGSPSDGTGARASRSSINCCPGGVHQLPLPVGRSRSPGSRAARPGRLAGDVRVCQGPTPHHRTLPGGMTPHR